MSDIPDDNWSERDDRNAEVAPYGFPPGLPAQIETIGRMMMGAVKRFWNKINPAYVTTGTGDNYVVAPESQTVFIHLYEIVRVRIDRTNTTATPTLKFGQTNARTIVKVGTGGQVPLIAGDLLAGQDHSFWYDGTSYVLSNPATVDSSTVVGVLKTANNLSELTPTAGTARTNIGLGNVDNTSDVNKPVSTAQASAIVSTGAAAVSSANAYTDGQVATRLPLSGGTMSGAIAMGGNTVSNAVLSASTINDPAGLLLSGTIYGLTLSNNASDPVNDIDISTGVAASSNATPVLMFLGSAITKRLDAAWAVGTGNGGLDTGSISNGSYHVWLIQRSDTGVVDALFSLSATAPTMPASYDRKRRIGSILRLAGSIQGFSQKGDRFLLQTGRIIRNTTASASSVLVDSGVPSGIQVYPILSNTMLVNASSSASNWVGDGDSASASFPIQSNNTGGVTSASTGTSSGDVATDTSGQIRWTTIISSGSISSNICTMYGWFDPIGR